MPHWLVVTLWIAAADVALTGVFVVFFRGANDVPDRAKRARSLAWKDGQ